MRPVTEARRLGSLTRVPGRRTGGSAFFHRLVNLLTLRLDVRSEVGRSTAFSLVLPAGGRGGAPRPALSGSAAEPPRKS